MKRGDLYLVQKPVPRDPRKQRVFVHSALNALMGSIRTMRTDAVQTATAAGPE